MGHIKSKSVSIDRTTDEKKNTIWLDLSYLHKNNNRTKRILNNLFNNILIKVTLPYPINIMDYLGIKVSSFKGGYCIIQFERRIILTLHFEEHHGCQLWWWDGRHIWTNDHDADECMRCSVQLLLFQRDSPQQRGNTYNTKGVFCTRYNSDIQGKILKKVALTYFQWRLGVGFSLYLRWTCYCLYYDGATWMVSYLDIQEMRWKRRSFCGNGWNVQIAVKQKSQITHHPWYYKRFTI